MIFLVNAENLRHFAADLAQVHHQRKALFVERAGWKVPVVADQEIDAYAPNCGWEANILGESLRDGEDQVTAIAADVSTEGLWEVRQRYGVLIPVPLSGNCDAGIPARTIGAATIPDLLRSNRYVIFDRLLPEDTVEQICEELEPSFAATECGQGDLSGRNTRIGAVLQKSPSSRAVAVHPIMLCVANAILGADCELFQLYLTQGLRVYPGQWERVPHRDDERWQGSRRGIEYLVNVMWALSDFTAENGAPMRWPRSHFNQQSPNLEPVEPVVAEMRRGSALVYLGSIMHCGGANLSREPLTGLHFSYCLDWLKQYDNPIDSYRPDVARQFPEILLGVLGLHNHGPNLRSSKGQDSSVLFDTDTRTPSPADVVPTGIARKIGLSRADGRGDAVAGRRTNQ